MQDHDHTVRALAELARTTTESAARVAADAQAVGEDPAVPPDMRVLALSLADANQCLAKIAANIASYLEAGP